MNSHTKRIAIIATILFTAAFIATILFVREINIQSMNLSEQITALKVDRAQEEVFVRIQRTSLDTAEVREELKSFFLQSQSDSIDFLNYIEAQAQESGVELVTNTPTEVIIEDVTYLSVNYVFTGSFSRVENFIKQLENIPYVSRLESLALEKQTSNVWKANVKILVHVLDYEKK